MMSCPFSKVRLLGVALAAGSLVVAGPVHATTIFDTSGASITCNTVFGSASLKPPITPASTGQATIKVKATLGGCIVTGATPSGLTILSGTLSGTVTTNGSGGCAGLAMPSTLTGNLVAKWKAASGQALDFKTTTVSGGNIAAGVLSPAGFGGATYAKFTFSGLTMQPNSAFAAGTPGANAATSEDIGNLNDKCANNPAGIKTIHLGVGELTL
jgi:hypothetical protein